MPYHLHTLGQSLSHQTISVDSLWYQVAGNTLPLGRHISASRALISSGWWRVMTAGCLLRHPQLHPYHLTWMAGGASSLLQGPPDKHNCVVQQSTFGRTRHMSTDAAYCAVVMHMTTTSTRVGLPLPAVTIVPVAAAESSQAAASTPHQSFAPSIVPGGCYTTAHGSGKLTHAARPSPAMADTSTTQAQVSCRRGSALLLHSRSLPNRSQPNTCDGWDNAGAAVTSVNTLLAHTLPQPCILVRSHKHRHH